MAGYIFYDLECTGLSPAFDVPVQAAFVRTCDDLVVQDELVLRARPPDHIVPSPEALLVTGLRPSDLIEAPLDQLGMMQAIAAFIEAAAPATIIGFNSLKYDEEMLRQAFFQNLLPPYQTSLGGHRRADVLVMARAVAALDPGAIRVPEQKGKPSFRLGELCRLNGIGLTEEDAHDALADVHATIELFRLLRERSPTLMAALLENADKRHVQARLDAGGLLGLLAFGTIIPVTGLMTAPANPSSMAVADLSVDPASYLDLPPAELVAAMNARGERPIRMVKLNAQPVLLPWSLFRHAAAPCETDAVHLERIRQISAHDDIWSTLPTALEMRFADRAPSPWPEGQLYDHFIPNGDARACVTWHRLDWDRRTAFAAENFSDERLRAFANRHAFLTAPQTLCDNGRRKGQDWLLHRLTTSEDVPWLTLPRALARCVELKVASNNDSERSHLDEIALWLAERLKAAQTSL
ncbi:exonuclease domain-containing protein [Bosea sp. TND4EK4]|uniref:exonuclease domain-containing protein n=1 Tax=Bosea sp. TND4EK4 TaxID=1907408 RepID=UPI0009543F2F|nr:exonuclease domain-containing protein [Bosea sp. TND4EK4]SIQ36605.1 Exodeoxyribonuclease I subunit C [Bosea sp. TND4EK4]